MRIDTPVAEGTDRLAVRPDIGSIDDPSRIGMRVRNSAVASSPHLPFFSDQFSVEAAGNIEFREGWMVASGKNRVRGESGSAMKP